GGDHHSPARPRRRAARPLPRARVRPRRAGGAGGRALRRGGGGGAVSLVPAAALQAGDRVAPGRPGDPLGLQGGRGGGAQPLPLAPARPRSALGGAERVRPQSGSRPPAGPVGFVVFQAGSRADGGVESVTQIIERLRGFRVLVVTQAETEANERWRRAGAEVRVWPLPYVMGTPRGGRSWRDGRLARAASTLRTNLRFFRLLRARGIRAVHCHDVLALLHAGFGARLAGARGGFNVRAAKTAGG